MRVCTSFPWVFKVLQCFSISLSLFIGVYRWNNHSCSRWFKFSHDWASSTHSIPTPSTRVYPRRVPVHGAILWSRLPELRLVEWCSGLVSRISSSFLLCEEKSTFSLHGKQKLKELQMLLWCLQCRMLVQIACTGFYLVGGGEVGKCLPWENFIFHHKNQVVGGRLPTQSRMLFPLINFLNETLTCIHLRVVPARLW